MRVRASCVCVCVCVCECVDSPVNLQGPNAQWLKLFFFSWSRWLRGNEYFWVVLHSVVYALYGTGCEKLVLCSADGNIWGS